MKEEIDKLRAEASLYSCPCQSCERTILIIKIAAVEEAILMAAPEAGEAAALLELHGTGADRLAM